MAALPAIAIGAIAGIGGMAAQALMKPKAPPAQMVARPSATPRTASLVSDALARRRGTRANQRTGSGGAESSTGAKKALMGT